MLFFALRKVVKALYNDRVSIQEIGGNIKRILGDSDTFLALVLILVSVASFGLGRLSVLESESRSTGVTQIASESAGVLSAVEEKLDPVPEATSTEQIQAVHEERYVGSKNGTKYHLPWCAGAQQIKEENKVWFGSKEEAEKAGYTPAANCKGI